MSDYYSAKDITAVKETLFKDLAKLFVSDAPRIVQCRDGENRLAKEVDDIINLLFWLDKKKLFDRLPKYICDSSDSISSARLKHRGMILFLNKMNKMQEELTVLRKFVRLFKPIIESLNIDTDIQKYISGPMYNLQSDRTVQPT